MSEPLMGMMGMLGMGMLGMLAELPSAELDPARAERIRRRCRARLARMRPSASHASVPPVKTMQAWQPLVAILGAAYLTEVVIQAFRLYAIL